MLWRLLSPFCVVLLCSVSFIYANNCINFREGNIHLSGMSISSSHLYFAIGTTLYRFPLLSFSLSKKELLITEDYQPIDLQKIFPRKYAANLTNKSMFAVKKGKEAEYLCFRDELDIIDCYSEHNPTVQVNGERGLLASDEWLLMNNMGRGFMLQLKQDKNYIVQGNIRMTNQSKLQFNVVHNYTLYRSQEDNSYLIQVSTLEKSDQGDFTETVTKDEAKNLQDFSKKRPITVYWQPHGWIVDTNAIFFRYGTIVILTYDPNQKGKIVLVKETILPAERFFQCNKQDALNRHRQLRFIFITILLAIAVLLAFGAAVYRMFLYIMQTKITPTKSVKAATPIPAYGKVENQPKNRLLHPQDMAPSSGTSAMMDSSSTQTTSVKKSPL